MARLAGLIGAVFSRLAASSCASNSSGISNGSSSPCSLDSSDRRKCFAVVRGRSLLCEGARCCASSPVCPLHAAMLRDYLFSFRPAFAELQRRCEVSETTIHAYCSTRLADRLSLRCPRQDYTSSWSGIQVAVHESGRFCLRHQSTLRMPDRRRSASWRSQNSNSESQTDMQQLSVFVEDERQIHFLQRAQNEENYFWVNKSAASSRCCSISSCGLLR
jgi:hypothetical protein